MSARTTSRIPRLVVLCLLACLAHAAGAQEMLATGQGEHGWAVLRATIGRQTSWTLYHLPRDAPPGTIARVRTLPTLPTHISTSGDRLLLVYEEPGQNDESIRSVRQVRVRTIEGQSRPRYEPAARGQVLPALPGWGTMRGFVALPDGAATLLQDESSERLELLRLDASGWKPVALPQSIEAQNVWGLVSTGESFGVVGIERDSAQQRLWLFQHATDQPDEAWHEPVPTDFGPTDVVVPGASNSLVLLQHQPDASVVATLHRSGQQVPLATLRDVGEAFVSLNVSDRIVLLWHEAEEEDSPSQTDVVRTQLRASVFSPISGEILYEGYAQPQSPLTDQDLQKLTLLFGAVLVMILLFVLRPDPVAVGLLQIPPGMVVTTPARRFGAGVIDLIPIAGLSAWIHSTSYLSALGIGIESGQLGLWPVLTTAALICAMQTGSEWLLGATPGKLAIGCRTLHAEGGKASFRQCLVRNLVKYACPPLAALLLLDPTRRHPGDYLAGTVVVMPRSGPSESEDAPQQDDPQAPDESPDEQGDPPA